MKYIVEHLESDVHDWCLLEYKHMIMQVGADNLIISHLDEDLIRRGIPQSLANAHCTSETVEALAFPKHQIVLLDPSSTEDLKPEDAQIFKYALFGGILGDDPPKDRTKELRVKGFATRNLGPVQMTTDTAVLVAKLVLEDGKALSEINYADRPEITLSRKESVTMPFRYVLGDQGITFPPGLVDLIKKDADMSLDDMLADAQ